jgi:hypothetical protein
VAKNLDTFHIITEILWEAELKDNWDSYLTEEISRQQSPHPLSYLLLNAFSLI